MHIDSTDRKGPEQFRVGIADPVAGLPAYFAKFSEQRGLAIKRLSHRAHDLLVDRPRVGHFRARFEFRERVLASLNDLADEPRAELRKHSLGNARRHDRVKRLPRARRTMAPKLSLDWRKRLGERIRLVASPRRLHGLTGKPRVAHSAGFPIHRGPERVRSSNLFRQGRDAPKLGLPDLGRRIDKCLKSNEYQLVMRPAFRKGVPCNRGAQAQKPLRPIPRVRRNSSDCAFRRREPTQRLLEAAHRVHQPIGAAPMVASSESDAPERRIRIVSSVTRLRIESPEGNPSSESMARHGSSCRISIRSILTNRVRLQSLC
jgi:hypothetical protein